MTGAAPLDLLAKILVRAAEVAAVQPGPLSGQRIRPARLDGRLPDPGGYSCEEDTGPGAGAYLGGVLAEASHAMAALLRERVAAATVAGIAPGSPQALAAPGDH